MFKIEKIKPNQILLVQQLAREIWDEHYIPIIGKAQVDYMLDKFYSTQKIQTEIEDGIFWEMIWDNLTPVGYLVCELRLDRLYLSKIYLKSNQRGKGLGKLMIERAKEIAIQHQMKSIFLNVNKHNSNSIQFYRNCGFEKTAEVVVDIGNGFVMDDFIFELNL